MSLNIANVDKLLAFMRALPPEHFTIRSSMKPSCGTPGCIAGCIKEIANLPLVGLAAPGHWTGLSSAEVDRLFCPPGWNDEDKERDYPLARAIDVVQYLRDTGEVDWARFPASTYRQPPAAPKPAWTPPVVIAVEPELPESLTSLLRQPVEAIDAG